MIRRNPLLALRAALITASLPLSAGLSACAPSDASPAASKPPATRVQRLRLWVGGRLADGLRATTRRGSCWTSSALTGRTDAYRCTVGDNILDPCLAAPASAKHSAGPRATGGTGGQARPDARRVACPLSPERVVVVSPTGPLPARVGKAAPARIWLITLAGGDQCVRRTGAGPAPRSGRPLSMTCRSGAFVWGEPDRSAAAWTVRTSRTENGAVTVRRVAAAYR